VPKLIDLTGKKFGKLIVKERAPNKNNQVCWLCKCDCGNEVIVTRRELLTGHTKSCGCYRKEITAKRNKEIKPKKLDGLRFGKLTVLKPTELRDTNGAIIWECVCDCGTHTMVRGNLLVNGMIQSCGCVKSQGEQKIIDILKKYDIIYEKEKTFETCRYPETNFLCRFDFYVNNKYLIEFDGEQHFKKSKYNNSWNTEQHLKETKMHDEYKNNWCKENNIPLIRIPYNHLNELKIEDLMLETSKFVI